MIIFLLYISKSNNSVIDIDESIHHKEVAPKSAVMLSINMNNVSSRGEPYSIKARMAEQKSLYITELIDVEVEFLLHSHGKLLIKAHSCIVDRNNETLVFNNKVHITLGSHKLHGDYLLFDLKNHRAQIAGNIEAQYNDIILQANQAELNEKNIIFENSVYVRQAQQWGKSNKLAIFYSYIHNLQLDRVEAIGDVHLSSIYGTIIADAAYYKDGKLEMISKKVTNTDIKDLSQDHSRRVIGTFNAPDQ